MKILGMHVDGFGTLSDLDIDDISPTLSIVCGPNEAGKSTLLDFVRTMLFGFPDRRSRQPQREPLRGGRHGGVLRILDDAGTEWSLERYADIRQPKLSSNDGRIGGEAELRSILGHADVGIFRSVFAFGLGELGSLAALEEDEVRDLIFTAGVLGAGKSATAALKALEERRSALVRLRSSARANDLQKKLEAAEHDLRERRRAASGFPSREADLRRLEAAAEAARERRLDREHRRAEIDQLLSCWPLWNRVRETEARIAQLAVPSDAELAALTHEPEIRRLVDERSGHNERVRILATRRAQLEGLEESRREYEKERASIQRRFSNQGSPPRSGAELGEASRSVQMLRSYISQRDQLEAKRDQREAIALRAASTHPTRWTSVVTVLLATLGAAALIGIVAIARHQSVIGIGAFAIAGALAIAIALVRSPARQRGLVPPQEGEGAHLGVDLGRLADDISRLSNALGLASQPLLAEVDAASLAIEQERDLRLSFDECYRKVTDIGVELEKLAEARVRITTSISEEDRAIASFESEARALAAACGIDCTAPAVDLCSRLSSILNDAENAASLRRTLNETVSSARSDLVAIIGFGPDADTVLDQLKTGDQAQLEAEKATIKEEIESAEAAWEDAHDAELEASRELDELASSSEIADLELEVASLRTELEAVLREWLVLGVASSLLKSTIDRYEKERQPEVIARASELFSLVTGGRYVRLLAREEERSSRHGIVAISERGGVVDSSSLSRGTAEQLYLCLRLALAATHAEQTVSLPFVLDDVLVNFDPERASAVIEAISTTANSHQVLAFTCHPHIVELIRTVVPGCESIALPSNERALAVAR